MGDEASFCSVFPRGYAGDELEVSVEGALGIEADGGINLRDAFGRIGEQRFCYADAVFIQQNLEGNSEVLVDQKGEVAGVIADGLCHRFFADLFRAVGFQVFGEPLGKIAALSGCDGDRIVFCILGGDTIQLRPKEKMILMQIDQFAKILRGIFQNGMAEETAFRFFGDFRKIINRKNDQTAQGIALLGFVFVDHVRKNQNLLSLVQHVFLSVHPNRNGSLEDMEQFKAGVKMGMKGQSVG